jgi:hypothetical protein
MKKKLTVFSCILLAGMASAQITITNSIAYKPGDSYTLQPCEADIDDVGAAGANVTVNLAALVDDGSETTASFVSASSTPHASSFPGANLAQPSVSTGGTAGYAYYNSSASKIELNGIYTSDYTMRYSNPMQVLKFPMNYLDSTYDDFAASYSTNGLDIHRSGYVATVADAWGNITTPAGTFPYLRYNITQVITDTILMAGEVVGFSYSETYTYSYMGDNSQAPLYSYNEVWSGSGALAYSSYAKNVFATGSHQLNGVLKTSTVYPNPATTNTNIEFTLKQANTVVVSVVDINGKTVYTHQSNQLQSGNHRINIETGDLAKGIYSAIIKTGTEQQVVKFSVQ